MTTHTGVDLTRDTQVVIEELEDNQYGIILDRGIITLFFQDLDHLTDFRDRIAAFLEDTSSPKASDWQGQS